MIYISKLTEFPWMDFMNGNDQSYLLQRVDAENWKRIYDDGHVKASNVPYLHEEHLKHGRYIPYNKPWPPEAKEKTKDVLELNIAAKGKTPSVEYYSRGQRFRLGQNGNLFASLVMTSPNGMMLIMTTEGGVPRGSVWSFQTLPAIGGKNGPSVFSEDFVEMFGNEWVKM